MFIVVRSKKDDLRPLSLYYYLNFRVKSQNKDYRLIPRVRSLKYAIFLRDPTLLQCPSVNIYRQQGRYDAPIIMGYLCLKTLNYRISSFGLIPNITEIRYNYQEIFPILIDYKEIPIN